MFTLNQRVSVDGRPGHIVGITHEENPRYDIKFDNGEIWVNVRGEIRGQLGGQIKKTPPRDKRGQT